MEIISELIHKIMNIEKKKIRNSRWEFTDVKNCRSGAGMLGWRAIWSRTTSRSGVTFAPEPGLALQPMAAVPDCGLLALASLSLAQTPPSFRPHTQLCLPQPRFMQPLPLEETQASFLS